MKNNLKKFLLYVSYFCILWLPIFLDYYLLMQIFPDAKDIKPNFIHVIFGLSIFIVVYLMQMLLMLFLFIKILKLVFGRTFVIENIAPGVSGSVLTRGLERIIQKWIDS